MAGCRRPFYAAGEHQPRSGPAAIGQTIVTYDPPDWKESARWTYPFDITELTSDRNANRALLVTRDNGLKTVDLGTGLELFDSPGKWSDVL